MKNANQTAIDEGRAQQFDEMMAQLAAMQAKYKGVRGELLAKVREEFEKLKPGTASESAPAPAPAKSGAASKPEPTPAPAKSVTTPSKPVAENKPAPAPEPAPAPAKPVTTPSKPVPAANRAAVQAMLPSCRLCGRSMKRADDGSLVCAVGHIRAAA